MKDVKFPTRKVVHSLVIACLWTILVSFASVFAFSFVGFIILFWVYLFSIWKLESKEYIFYYSIKTIRALFFFLPLSAVFYSISLTNTMVESSWSSLEAWATAVWWAIWGFIVIGLCLIIWLVWGLIIWTFAKKPKKEQNTWRSIWILFLIILWLSFYYLSQTSEVEKVINWDNMGTQKNTSNIISTTSTWVIIEEKKNNKEGETKLSDLLSFKLTSYNLVKWDWSDSFEFSYEIENKSWKNILWYKWSFEIFDLFDDSLWKFNIDKIETFSSWTLVKEKWNYSYNEFLSDNVKLWKAKFEDLKYKYSISKIIYENDYDFSNKVFWNNTWKDIDKVSYEIESKESKKWDFQNYIEFEVKIENSSEKTIKGIKWGFSIYNIFWEKLWSYEVNITKEIKSWANISEKMQYSINEFMNKENEIYETDFSLLKYNFNIENIVYSE